MSTTPVHHTTDHRLVGATVRAIHRTHGLRPAQAAGEPETVESVYAYDNTVLTEEGNLYLSGSYTVVRMAEKAA